MAVTTINVVGTVVLPDGTGMPGGKIEVRLLGGTATVDDGGTTQVIALARTVVIGAAGSVDFDLVPTDDITLDSGGTPVYRMVFTDADGNSFTRLVQLPADSPDPIQIGALPVVLELLGSPTVTALTAKGLTVTDIDSIVPGFGLLGVSIFEDPGAGQETMSYRVHRTASGTYAAIVDLAGATAEGRATTEPVASEGNIGRVLLIDDGGETYSVQGHRDSSGNPVWLTTSAGGS